MACKPTLILLCVAILLYVPVVVAETQQENCIKVVEETHGLPIWDATIIIEGKIYHTDKDGINKSLPFSFRNYSYFLKINPTIEVHKKGYYSYYGNATYYVPVAGESIVIKQPYLIEDDCLVIKLKSKTRLEVIFPEIFNVSVSINNESVGYTDIHTDYKFNNTKNFTYIFKRNKLFVYGLTPKEHEFNFTPNSPTGYDSKIINYSVHGDCLINIQFPRKKQPWDDVLSHFRQFLSGDSSDTTATDAALSDIFDKLLAALILTASLWLFLSSHIFKERRYKDLEMSFILASVFFILAIVIDIVAIFLNSFGRIYYFNTLLLFLMLFFYLLGWVFVFDFMYGMRSLFLKGPILYVSLFDKIIAAPFIGFLNDIKRVWRRNRGESYIIVTLSLILPIICIIPIILSNEILNLFELLFTFTAVIWFILAIAIVVIFAPLAFISTHLQSPSIEFFRRWIRPERDILPVVTVPVIIAALFAFVPFMFGLLFAILDSFGDPFVWIPIGLFVVFILIGVIGCFIKRRKRPGDAILFVFGSPLLICGIATILIGPTYIIELSPNIFKIFFFFVFCAEVLLKIDFLTRCWIISSLKPLPQLQIPEKFMENHEDAKLFYYYNRDDVIPSNRSEGMIFCISDSKVPQYDITDQFILDGLRNGEFCKYVVSAGSVDVTINHLIEKKKNIEKNVLKLYENKENNEAEINRFKHTMGICTHYGHVKSVIKSLLLKKIREGKLNKENFINFISLNNHKKEEIERMIEDIQEHYSNEKFLRKINLPGLTDILRDIRDFIKGKIEHKITGHCLDKELEKKLEMFGIKEKEKLAKILIFEAKYAAYETEYKRVVNEAIVNVINKIIEEVIGKKDNQKSEEEIIKEIMTKLEKLVIDLNDDEKKKIINAIKFAKKFESEYCIFKKFGGIIKEIGTVVESDINNKEDFFNNIAKIIKLRKLNDAYISIKTKIESVLKEIDRKKWGEVKTKIESVLKEIEEIDKEKREKWDKIKTKIESVLKEIEEIDKEKREKWDKIKTEIESMWRDYFKNNLTEISKDDYANYPYYYEQYRELSRLKWFFSDIEDYTKSNRLVMIDAFSSYKGMEEKERFRKDPINKKILYKDILYDLVLFFKPLIRDWLYNQLYKGHILVRKYEIPPGNIPKMHQCSRLIRNSIFSIPTVGGVYLEEYCNRRVAYDKFSDFFEVADPNHLLQILHHFKIQDKINFGQLTLITIKPKEFERSGFPHRTIDDLATELSHIYFTLEDTGKEDPKARVRIIKHHNRDEETKEGEYYDLCKRHGWLYLEGCGYEEEEPSISEILKGISANGREKLEEEIKDIIELEKRGRVKKGEEYIKDTIKKILKEEGLSAAAMEVLLRRIWRKPEEVLHKLKETEKLMMEEPYEIKEYVEHGKEIDAAIWIFAMAGSYVLIKEALHLLGL